MLRFFFAGRMSECSAYQAIHIPAKMIVSDKKIITVSIEGRQRFAGLFISHNPLRGRRYRGDDGSISQVVGTSFPPPVQISIQSQRQMRASDTTITSKSNSSQSGKRFAGFRPWPWPPLNASCDKKTEADVNWFTK